MLDSSARRCAQATRRQLLHRAGLAALGVGMLPWLEACAGRASAPTAQPTPMPAPTAAPNSVQSPTAAKAGASVVEMSDQLRFVPNKLTVKVGETVTWHNASTVAHTVTDDPAKAQNPTHAKLPPGVQPWDSGTVSAGESWSRTFDTAGEYRYFCIPHEAAGMFALLTVT